jgi:hypothetical protein
MRILDKVLGHAIAIGQPMVIADHSRNLTGPILVLPQMKEFRLIPSNSKKEGSRMRAFPSGPQEELIIVSVS